MPTAPGDTMKAYEAYVSATNDEDKVRKLEIYLNLIPKHKGTEKERGLLRRKLAQMRVKLSKKSGPGGGKELNVRKEGAAQIVFAGFPNAGKSSLLCEITNADVKIANYEFTTLEPNVGMLPINNVNLQLVDLPGLIKGAAKDKGMGKRFLTVMRNSDVVAFVLDVSKEPIERLEHLLREFAVAGIRLNKEKPDVRVYKKESGGIEIMGAHLLTCDKNDVLEALRDFGIVNADVRINRRMGLEDFIDAIDKSVVWKKALVVLTKTDNAKQNEVNKIRKEIEREYNFTVVPISTKDGENLDKLRKAMWDICELICVYTITSPDSDPLVIPKGSTIIEAAMKIHSDFAKKFKYARVWGKSVKYEGQRVGKEHVLKEGDIIELNS